MNPRTQRTSVAGPAGMLEVALDAPAEDAAPRGMALVCHPNPQQGGTMDHKVVQTLARAFMQLGYRCVRFNFRGVGASQGAWDDGRGEVDDALAVVAALRDGPAAAPAATAATPVPLVLAGFSFGGFVAAQAAARLPDGARAERLVMVGPSMRYRPPPVPADTLLVHGETDDVVLLAAVFDWARPQSLPVTVIPGAGHFFHGQLALLKSIVLAAWH